MSKSYKVFIFTLLAALAAFGPIVTDMYLPALPLMTNYFSTSPSLVQLGLTASLIGLALGQLIVGPMSDKFGRKRPLLISLIIFVLATIACIFSPNIEIFTLSRFIQGMAGAGGIVLSKSITTDLFSGEDLTKSFAIITAVHGLAPTLAPIMGGMILNFGSWQGVFITLMSIGILLFFMSFFLTESLPDQKRIKTKTFATFHQFVPVFRNKQFNNYAFLQGVSIGILFSYIAASPFIFQEIFGLSPFQFSLCFAINATALGLGNLVITLLKNPKLSLKIGVFGTAIAAILAGCMLSFSYSIIAVEISLFLILLFLGIVLPTSTVLAMEIERMRAGTASAVLGALAFLVGGIVAPLVCLGNVLYATSFIFLLSASGMVFFFRKIGKTPQLKEEI